MKISDLKEEDIVVGLRIRGLKTGRVGTIVRIDLQDDRYAWIQWEGDEKPTTGFYWNDCECEVIEDER